ncbi:hypothetical protein M5D96_010624 [Drosophila gunungcola]|uniref:Uncharacterized protein n=1 Tax=Drosophila gunungcola TaxID=103775 RepID=A0A9P9YGL9_9MUSC|nr:hypothetical protein M5D96_010624 [Drosophila gunungcola]
MVDWCSHRAAIILPPSTIHQQSQWRMQNFLRRMVAPWEHQSSMHERSQPFRLDGLRGTGL